MTAFTPTTFSLEPEDRPDDLGGAVLQSLTRPIGRRRPWGAMKTLILGTITFGLGPALSWPRAIREDISVERNQLWHMADWLRVKTGRPEAVDLRDRAQTMGFRGIFWFASFLLLAVLVGNFVGRWPFAHFDMDRLVSLTYRPDNYFSARFDTPWNVILSIVYGVHWLQIQLHARDMRSVVRRFNALAGSNSLPLVRMPSVGLGLSPFWVVGAVLLCCINAWWGIPMMLAGAVHQRYVNNVSTPTRQQMAMNLRAILLAQRPALNVPLPLRLRNKCAEPRCQTLLPKDAKFCPRCGSRNADGPIDVVA